jgi:hypothetical protein
MRTAGEKEIASVVASGILLRKHYWLKRVNSRGQVMAWAASMMLALTAHGASQGEQWLQYRTSTEGRGHRWLELTTNPPPSVPLPPISGQSTFARWDTPLDPQGRWLCFERTRKAGPHHRVYVDRNGNGRLDDEVPLDAAAVDPYSAAFEPVRLVFKGEDGPLTYHLLLRFMRYDDGETRLLAESGCYYAGNVDFAGRKRELALVDANVNGTFNDRSPDPADGDALRVEGDQVSQRYLGRLLEVEGLLFAISVPQDGAFVQVQAAKNVPLASVRVPEVISEVVVVGGPGHFVRLPTNGAFTLPVGPYRVHGWSIERKDDKGADWKLSGSGFGEFAGFEATVEKAAALDIGEPVLAALTVTENRGGATFGLRLKGRLGESVELLKGKERPRPPQLHLAGPGGSFRSTNSFEYG